MDLRLTIFPAGATLKKYGSIEIETGVASVQVQQGLGREISVSLVSDTVGEVRVVWGIVGGKNAVKLATYGHEMHVIA